MPTKANNWKTPISVWSEHDVSFKGVEYKKLHTFGCVFYYHGDRLLRKSHDVPGRKGLFLGYDSETIDGVDLIDNRLSKLA
jgi:hypothetical protein